MTRFSRALATLLMTLWMSACGGGAEDQESRTSAGRHALAGGMSPDRLNVVLITIDTLRADRLSVFGSDIETPGFDRLAEEGVLFSNASTTVPFTLPAHSSIMTGTYPPFHGVRENVGYFLGEENTTLAEMMAQSGRDTAGFVSAFVLDSRWGIGRGFEHYHDDFDLGAFQSANLGSVQRPGEETIAAVHSWLDRPQTGEGGREPFFLWLHLFDAHDPYTPPEPFRSQYPGRLYDAEVAYTDSLLDGFLEDLEARGLLESTVVVVTADHGEGLGDHGEAFHGYFVYDSTVHVPLVFRLPGKASAGRRVREAVSHVDIVPTILDLTGQSIPDRVQGRSLVGALAGEELGEDEPEPVVYAESFYPLLHYGWSALRALRSESFKYIEAPAPELFDLASDPAESENLYPGSGGVGRSMARQLLDLGVQLEQGAASSAAADLDEQTLAQLRALGYVAGPGETDARSYDPRIPRNDPKEAIGLHRKIMRAQGLAGDDKAAEAKRLLEEALAEDSALIDVHQLLGDLELQASDFEAAAGHFERALALDGQHKSSLFGLATAHHRMGRADDAVVGYQLLLSIAGQDSKATLAIADIEVKRGRLEEARHVLRDAAQPGAPALLFNRLGEVMTLEGQQAEARRWFEEAIDSNPDLSQPRFNLAVLFEESDDLVKAQRYYEEAIERSPRHYQAQFNLARLKGRMGDAEGERELLEKAIESKSDFALGYIFLGKSLMDSNELDKAEEETRAGLDLIDESELGWYVLADILNRRGRRAEANQALARARALAEAGDDTS